MIEHRWRRAGAAGLSATLILVVLATSCRRRDDEKAGPAAVVDTQYDLRFLDTMNRHHRQAIEVWELVAERAGHPELRQYAGKAIDEQKREIVLMDMWRNRWWSDVPRPVNREEAAEMTSGLREARGEKFDAAFLAMMIPHHERAAAMARDAVQNASMVEVRQLAQIIVNQQEEEVAIMSAWQKAWSIGATSETGGSGR